MKRFYLHRIDDESGVSGTGDVAIGIELPSKRVVMEWLVSPYTISFHNSIESVIQVHGHGGKTQVKWIDKERIEINVEPEVKL